MPHLLLNRALVGSGSPHLRHTNCWSSFETDMITPPQHSTHDALTFKVAHVECVVGSHWWRLLYTGASSPSGGGLVGKCTMG